MKKLIAICLLLVLSLSFVGCSGTPTQTMPAPVPTEEPEHETESATQSEIAGEPSDAEKQNTVLVVYFSATGTTRGVAERIATLTGADLAEIVPAQPYTAEDLNYSDRSTRATVEQNTPDIRPEIANETSLDGYTTVYLGYPIWWGQAPRILSTFVESHDFTGITVIPFCTSGGSGAGRTGETLGEQAGTGTFLSSTRLNASISDANLQAWIEK